MIPSAFKVAIYLDNHATTPVDERVLDAMLPYLKERFGNSSSRSHHFGWDAEKAVHTARKQVADLLGADPREILFTSGATESNNLAIKGTVATRAERGNHIIASPIEHPSVTDTLEHLAGQGCEVTYLAADETGRVRAEDVAAAIRESTILITVMAANNEVGTIQPLREIGRIAREHDVWLHSDATQGVGKIAFDVTADGVQLAALTAHKIYGPKGCGALYVRRKDPAITLPAQLHGGGQERAMRPGTLNVPGIVGLGAACALCAGEHDEEAERTLRLRNRLQERLFSELEGVELNGHPEERLPGNLHVSFTGVDSQALMMLVPEVAVSAGAACASGSIEPSHVLRAMGVSPARAGASVRFGVGRFTTADEIERAADLFVAAVRKLREPTRR